MFQAVLQHGPGNPVVIEDDEEKEIEDPVIPGGDIGQLFQLRMRFWPRWWFNLDDGGPTPEYVVPPDFE